MPKRLAISLLLLLPLGCFGIYVPDPGLGDTRGAIDSRDLKSFAIGATTREEILLTLGEPDFQSEDGSVILYWWYSWRGFIAVIGYGVAGAGTDGSRISLVLKFDDAGRVLRHKFVHSYGSNGSGLEGYLGW